MAANETVFLSLSPARSLARRFRAECRVYFQVPSIGIPTREREREGERRELNKNAKNKTLYPIEKSFN